MNATKTVCKNGTTENVILLDSNAKINVNAKTVKQAITKQRKIFELSDLIEGSEWATPFGKITFFEKEEAVFAVTINGELHCVYGGKQKTLNFINKKLSEALELYGDLICYK